MVYIQPVYSHENSITKLTYVHICMCVYVCVCVDLYACSCLVLLNLLFKVVISQFLSSCSSFSGYINIFEYCDINSNMYL